MLDPISHDLVYVNGDHVLISDTPGHPDQIIQAVKCRLLTIKGELFYDNTIGCIDVSVLATKGNVKNLVDAAIKSTIVSTAGVVSITSYTSTLSNRALTVTFTANTIYGTTGSQTVPVAP